MLNRECVVIDAGAVLEQPLSCLVNSFGLAPHEYDDQEKALAGLQEHGGGLVVINTTAQKEGETAELVNRIKSAAPETIVLVLTDREPLDLEEDNPLVNCADLVLNKPCTIYQFQEAVLPVIQPFIA